METALGELALSLAEDRFDERVETLIASAHGKRGKLAMAAATLLSLGPTTGDPKEQVASALLLEAAHRCESGELRPADDAGARQHQGESSQASGLEESRRVGVGSRNFGR